MSKPLICLGDFDSLAYAAGRAETEKDMQIVVNNKVSLIIKRTGTKKIIGWVEVCTNKQNFRKHVATTRPYKGKRSSTKPTFLNQAKQYMVDMGWARWCNYIESEDMVLISANEYGIDNCILTYIDKDLKQQHGRVYDYRTDKLYTITPEQANYYLWRQILTGDIGTDNIVGIYGVDDAKADDILANVEPSDYPRVIAEQYIKRGYSYDYLVEQCRLVYLLRHRGDVFYYPIDREGYDEIRISYSGE